MKQQNHAHPRAIAMLMAAVALPLTPAFAQDAAPPVAATVTPPSAPAPVEAAPPAAAAPAPTFAPQSPVVQAVPVRPVPPAEPVAEAAPVTPRAAAQRPAPRREVRTVAAPLAAPVVSAPAVTPAPSTPETAIAAPEAPVAADTLPSTIPVETPDTPVVEPVARDTTPWLLILGGLAVLAVVLGLIFSRRRGRSTVASKRPAHIAPPLVREPVAPLQREPVAPIALNAVMREPVQPVTPKPVAPIVATNDERPWIGLSLAPICAGTTEGGTMVQYELIVDNASDVPAQDVRVSSFLIDGARSSAAEQALIQPLGETQSQTVDIAANGSVPITTTIHVNRNDLSADAFEPKIVAEARYPLPGGGEGHFAARFAIGITDGDAIKAVGLRDGDGIHDDVGAELDDVLERV